MRETLVFNGLTLFRLDLFEALKDWGQKNSLPLRYVKSVVLVVVWYVKVREMLNLSTRPLKFR